MFGQDHRLAIRLQLEEDQQAQQRGWTGASTPNWDEWEHEEGGGLGLDEREAFGLMGLDFQASRGTRSFEASRGVAPEIVSLPMQYEGGATRVTRTPGRHQQGSTARRNTVSLGDLVKKQGLKRAFISSYCIGQDEFFDFLPFSGEGPHSLRDVPIFINRDLRLDPFLGPILNQIPQFDSIKKKACKSSSFHVTEAEHALLATSLATQYAHEYGPNFRAVYSRSEKLGIPHSKVGVLVHVNFVRIFITSANMVSLDTVEGNNQFFILDLPFFPPSDLIEQAIEPNDFAETLCAHLLTLACPPSFLNSLRSCDWSAFKSKNIKLVISEPGYYNDSIVPGISPNLGLAGLNHISFEILGRLERQIVEEEKLLEVCSASVGQLDVDWVLAFQELARGFQPIRKLKKLKKWKDWMDEEKPNWELEGTKIVYPSVSNVASWDAQVRQNCSNIGSHLDWKEAPNRIKSLFYQFESKPDPRRSFYMKSLILHPPQACAPASTSASTSNSTPPPLPYWIYVGSANFSKGAWGSFTTTKVGGKTKTTMRLANSECGVVVPGTSLMSLLEEGTEIWEEVVPYVRPQGNDEGRLWYGAGDRPFKWHPNLANGV